MNARWVACVLAGAIGVLGVPVDAAPGTISIDARDTDIGDVIRLIGAESDRNVLPDGSIAPRKITFRLRDVDPDTALAALASAYGLQLHRDGSIVLVGTAAEMNRRFPDAAVRGGARTTVFSLVRARPDEVAAALLATLPVGTVAVGDKRTGSVILTANDDVTERARRIVVALDAPGIGSNPLSTAALTIRNAKPANVVKTLKAALPDVPAIADDASNTVVVSGSSDALATARTLVAGLDRPARQVMFEVKVTDVKPNDDSSNVGIEFGGATFGTSAQGQLPYTLIKGSLAVNAQINALVQNGRAQILATPRIATLNNREASLLIGEQYPVVTVNQQTGYPNVENVDVGVQLRVTPTIGDDGVITADLHPAYSQIIGFNANVPIVANRKIDATLRVRDGETIVLGGLFEDTTSETIAKLPWLGDLPVLGGFFRNKQTTHERDEVVFLITPHVL